jgi:hypothetical protein
MLATVTMVEVPGRPSAVRHSAGAVVPDAVALGSEGSMLAVAADARMVAEGLTVGEGVPAVAPA